MPTGQPFLVMEYLEGVSLLDVLRSEGPLEPKRAVKIFSEVADGLFHAHKVGILHRDLKPSNIILINQKGDNDFVKVVDFGLAKLMPWSGKESQHLTKTGEVFGSPIYMSPEQCMGKQLWPTSDIYSLGITLFEALTGKPPFRGANSIQTASKHMTETPPHFADVRPDLPLPEGLEKVVLKCLNKKAEDRFQDMSEFKDALQAGLNTDRVEMPASLMVSTQAIPAISANTQIPSSVQRAVVESARAAEPKPEKKGIHPGVFIAAGAAVVVGAAAFAFIPIADQTEGTITYYDFDQDNVVHIVDKNNEKTVLKLSGAPPAGMHDRADDSCLGSQVVADFDHNRFADNKSGTMKAISFSNGGEPDEPPKQAVAVLNDFLNIIADNWEARIKDYDTELVSKFLSDNRGPYQYLQPDPTGHILSQAIKQETTRHRPGDRVYPDKVRPAHAYKLQRIDRNDYTILVDGSHFCITPPDSPLIWKFVVQRISKDGYSISSYEKASDTDWNAI
jgi:serine/threonine protein kinase